MSASRKTLTIKTRLCLVAATLLCTSAATAQPRAARLGVGDQVRFTLTRDTAASFESRGVRCEAQVSQLLMDTVAVRPYGRCALPDVRFWKARDLQVEGNRGSRLGHFVAGTGFGLLVGGIAGLLIAGDGCHASQCDDGALAVLELTLVGITAGGVVGAGVGLLLPAGSRWVSVPNATLRFDDRAAIGGRIGGGPVPSAPSPNTP